MISNEEDRNKVIAQFKQATGWGTRNYSVQKRDQVAAETVNESQIFGIPNYPMTKWGELFPEILNNKAALEALANLRERSPKSREDYQKISGTPLFTPLSEEAADKIRGGTGQPH